MNGVEARDPAAALAALMPAPGAPALLRAEGGATVQRLVDVAEALRAAGDPALALVP